MGTGEESRVQQAAAERYESELAATVLLKTATHMIDRAHIEPGSSVLDVGCGTGVVARECIRRVGPNGTVIGLDISREMLAVANRVAPDVEWIQGDAGMPPFPSELFDRVLSQFALMFFPDQEHALSDIWRVLRPDRSLLRPVPVHQPQMTFDREPVPVLFSSALVAGLHQPSWERNQRQAT